MYYIIVFYGAYINKWNSTGDTTSFRRDIDTTITTSNIYDRYIFLFIRMYTTIRVVVWFDFILENNIIMSPAPPDFFLIIMYAYYTVL